MKLISAFLALGLTAYISTPSDVRSQEVQAAPTEATTTPQTAPAFTVRVTGKGPPVLLIPGLSCDGTVWNATVEQLKGEYECHVLSLAGFGGTAPIAGPFLPKVHDQILAYIKSKQLNRPAIIGHSLGGTLAYSVASSEPTLIGPIIAVDGVPFLPALMNPTATAESSKPFAEQMQAMVKLGGQEGFESQTRLSITGMVTDPAVAKSVADHCIKSDPATVGLAMREMMSSDLRPRITSIKSPVLQMASVGTLTNPTARDYIQAAYQAQVANLPTAKVVVAPDSRHFIMLDNPTWFHTTVKEFLKEHRE